jgi:hypothetical protein
MEMWLGGTADLEKKAVFNSLASYPRTQWLSPCSTQRPGWIDQQSKTDPMEMTVIDRAPVRSIWHGRIHWV